MAFLDYRSDTIKAIREHGGVLDELSDDDLAHLYSKWSSVTASASWFVHSTAIIKSFYVWATVPPYLRIPK